MYSLPTSSVKSHLYMQPVTITKCMCRLSSYLSCVAALMNANFITMLKTCVSKSPIHNIMSGFQGRFVTIPLVNQKSVITHNANPLYIPLDLQKVQIQIFVINYYTWYYVPYYGEHYLLHMIPF